MSDQQENDPVRTLRDSLADKPAELTSRPLRPPTSLVEREKPLPEQFAAYTGVADKLRDAIRRRRVEITHAYDSRQTELRITFERDRDQRQRRFEDELRQLGEAYERDQEELRVFTERIK